MDEVLVLFSQAGRLVGRHGELSVTVEAFSKLQVQGIVPCNQ